jgi:arylformamidase
MPPRVHDISVPNHPGMLHYGRKPEKTMVESIAAGDPGNVSRWLIGSHTGTHVDAPNHFVEGATTIESLGLDVLVGPAVVLDLTSVDAQEITAEDLRAAGLDDSERVLLKTRNSTGALREPEKSPWVGLSKDAAELLVQRGVRLVGIDYLTIDSPAGETGWPVHHVLCGAGVVILEVIDLSEIAPGRYTLASLPIKLVGSEAAPARAILMDLGLDSVESWDRVAERRAPGPEQPR